MNDRAPVPLIVGGIALAILFVAALVAHPMDVLLGAIVVAPITATIATWYLRHVYLSDRRKGPDGRPIRSRFLRISWRSSALVTVAGYPIAGIAAYGLVREPLHLGTLPPGFAVTVLGVFILVALVVPHWLAIAVLRLRRAQVGPIDVEELPEGTRGDSG